MARLAERPRAAIANALVTLELTARHRLRLPGRLRRIEVRERGARLALLVEDIGDVHAVREVFADRTYELSPAAREALGGECRVIADLGSHIGASVAWFRAQFPAARIIGFEPNPRSYRKLADVAVGWPGVDVHRVAIAGAPGRRRLSIPSDEQINARLAADGANGAGPEVDCLTLAQACDRAGVERIDLLKLDIEGSELEVLRAFPGLDRVRVTIGEFHPGLAGDRADLEAALAGFETKWTEQPKGDPLFVAVNVRAAPAPAADA
jgi:FkbM family methyltransferase